MRNINSFIVLLALPFLFTISNAGSGGKGPSIGNMTINGLTAILSGAVVVGVILVILGVMTTKLELEAAKGNVVSISELWNSTKSRMLSFILLGIAIGVIVFLGFLALVIPGFILLRRYVFAPYIFLDDDKITVTDAMRKSAELSKPFSGYIWGVIGITLLLALTGILPLIGSIVSFALTSLYSVAMPLRYLEIKKLVEEEF